MDLDKNSDFFMFANLSDDNPNYFFGEISISKQEEIQFNSTNFLVKNIKQEIGGFFDSFVKNREQENSTETLNNSVEVSQTDIDKK